MVPLPFGVSIGDVIGISQQIAYLIGRVRDPTSKFREFSSDLQLARSVFGALEANFHRYSADPLAISIQPHRQTLHQIFDGIRDSLEALRAQVDRHAGVGPVRTSLRANYHFTGSLEDLRRRLQFHMSSLQLVIQNLSLAQGRRIEAALALITNAQHEQEQDDLLQRWEADMSLLGDSSVRQSRAILESDVNETFSSTSMASRDELINLWLHQMDMTFDANESTIYTESQSGQVTAVRFQRREDSISESSVSNSADSGQKYWRNWSLTLDVAKSLSTENVYIVLTICVYMLVLLVASCFVLVSVSVHRLSRFDLNQVPPTLWNASGQNLLNASGQLLCQFSRGGHWAYVVCSINLSRRQMLIPTSLVPILFSL
jgi:hypothetical protein